MIKTDQNEDVNQEEYFKSISSVQTSRIYKMSMHFLHLLT